ncbi:MmgE/PrpD family protein [Kutzneria buriramensis]|uniref:2-methylcitrate dehydratase PrpD n=1 Tax=Kutzneria buriramensis TaxID=1045776 RepID=A0A3E0I6M0_9PSEU|nr:MmgE/PrpD family protein [Kutzneria buriramensis]REH54277.1 2-methylcitrate dehydratase PrpD [Kutzneria buriramensis]
MTATTTLSNWLADLTWDAVPPTTRTRAKHLVLDGLACALIGAQLPWSRIAVQGVTSFEGNGSGTVIGWGRTISPPAAALLNGTFIQGFELDDFHPLAPVHSCSIVLPSLLATAELLGGVSGKDFLLGVVAGFEVGPRVGLALHGAQMLNRGWHSGSVFGPMASAAASGVLRGLTAAQFEDAIALGATQSSGLMAAQYEAMSKRMHHGFASRNGFYAAGLAAAGYTGIKQVFERGYGGFLSTFGEGHDPDITQITHGLGEIWHTDLSVIKAHAAMGGLHGGIQAALSLRDKASPNEIERIDIDVTSTVYHHGWWTPQRPMTTIGAQMNIGYAVAVALLDGEVMPAQFTAQRIDSDDVWSLLPRVDVKQDNELGRFATRLTITLKDGAELTELVEQPRGGPANPLSNDDIVTKYRALTAGVLEPERAEAIESHVLALDTATDICDLIRLLAAPVCGALD